MIEGKALYQANCATCHGVIETSTKLGATVARITTAIAQQSEMTSLSSLSPKEIMAIVDGLSLNSAPDSQLACASAPDVGTIAMHRLNQFEYRNTIRSVTGVNLVADPNFPSEEIGEFNNSAANLKITAAQMEWYLNTALSVVDALIDTDALRTSVYNCNLSVPSCWKGAIKTFADRAYRRPASGAELTKLESLYSTLLTDSAPSDVAIKTVYQGILISPQFLFRNVSLPDPNSLTVKKKLTPYELAERISYFIWADAPDATLINKALSGQLSQASGLRAEVARMLNDNRAKDHLSDNFFTFWLGLHNLKNASPNPILFAEFNDNIRDDMMMESKLFFRELISTDRPLADLLTANYSFLNQRLANFYGIPGVSGGTFRKVSLNGTSRTGALTHGSLMTVTSHSGGTSIVRRGAFIALNLQCIEIPSPPAGVGISPPPNGTDSVRKRLEAHRSNPNCASCHNIMDPPGFGLENFSAIGKTRVTDDEGFPLDTMGQLFNGKRFSNAHELAAALTDDRTYQRCGIKKLATFALGRKLETFDACTIEKIVNSAGSKSITDTITELILSDPFQFERGG